MLWTLIRGQRFNLKLVFNPFLGPKDSDSATKTIYFNGKLNHIFLKVLMLRIIRERTILHQQNLFLVRLLLEC